MPKFSYTVINQEDQKLTGTIEADSETLAREALNKLGFPILDITQVNEEIAEQIMGKSRKFEFQAVDQNGRRVIGTIASEDKYMAFRRLVTEYHFAVEYIYLSSLSVDAKDEEKKRGVVELYTALKNEQAKIGNKFEEQELLSKEENERMATEQADFVLQKVTTLIKDFSEIIKPEDKNVIQKKADRLTRLKTSKNIDYVKHLAEDLLIYVQNQEIYLTKEKSDKKLQSFRLDVKRLLNDIHREKVGTSWDQEILGYVKTWNKNHIENNSEPFWWEKLVKDVFDFVENILSDPPEVTLLKDKIRIVNQQIWDYYKMYFKEDTMETRAEIKDSIRNLKEQKSELKVELSNLRKKLDEEAELTEQETLWDKINDEFISITAWFFGIYFTIHTVYAFMLTKKLPITISLPFSKVTELRGYYITMLILLILHGTFQIRVLASMRKSWGNIILYPLATLCILLAVFNF
ncbi:hypothetical protein KAZ92_01655 [Candidatus Gracilibacteria bacterium]|nr:hypothetical protein [Candidatus Gracilibacteria bacterium]